MPFRALTFLLMVAYVPMVPSSGNVGRWAVLSLGAALMIWTVRVRSTPAHWMLLGLLTWMALGLLWSVSPADTVGELFQWTVLAVMFLVAAETEDLAPAVEGLLAGVLVNAGFVGIQLSNINIVDAYQPNVGLFVSRNVSVEVGVVAAILALGYRLWWGLPAALTLVLAGGGLEGALMVLCAGAFLLLTREALKLGSLWYLVAAAWVGPLVLLAYFEAPHLTARLPIWQYVIEYLQPFGYGLGSFGALRGHDFEFAHNEFLHYSFELGLGVLPLIGIMVYAFLASDVTGRVAVSALTAAMLVWFPLHHPATGLLFVLLAGHLCGVRGRYVLAQRQGRAANRPSGEVIAAVYPGPSGAARPGRVPLPMGQEPTPRAHTLPSHLGGTLA